LTQIITLEQLCDKFVKAREHEFKYSTQYYLKSSDENEKKVVQVLNSPARDEEEVKVWG
jgi:hypothetical protein